MAQTQKGNAVLALSCYAVLFRAFATSGPRADAYFDDVVGAKHALIDWQGSGPGILTSGAGSLAIVEWCPERICELLAGASDAEARPAMATNKAKKRITVFIFGNPSHSNLKRNFSLLEGESYRRY